MPRVKKIDIRPSLPIAINTGVNISTCRRSKYWFINGSFYGYSLKWKVNKYGDIRSNPVASGHARTADLWASTPHPGSATKERYPDLPTHEALSNGYILAVSVDVNGNKIVGVYYPISVGIAESLLKEAYLKKKAEIDIRLARSKIEQQQSLE